MAGSLDINGFSHHGVIKHGKLGNPQTMSNNIYIYIDASRWENHRTKFLNGGFSIAILPEGNQI